MNEPILPPVAIPAKQLPRLGDFKSKPVVHAFVPSPKDVAYGTAYYGLVESDFWPYGMVLTENGRWFAYVRSISGRATTGLGILGQAEGPGDPLRLDLRAAESCVGGLRRATTDDTDLYEAAGPGPAFSLHAGTERVDWMEGSNLRLSGPIASPGLQMLVAWREIDGTVSHMLYAHVAYEVHGEVLGEHASGYLGLAKVYMPYGLEWLVSGRRFTRQPGCVRCGSGSSMSTPIAVPSRA